MTSEKALAVFEGFKIRRVYDEESETWYFSGVRTKGAREVKRMKTGSRSKGGRR